jgi:DNA-directed RNA polymerase subunit RPC12/RpoP
MATVTHRGTQIYHAGPYVCGQCSESFEDGLSFELDDLPSRVEISCPRCNAFVAEWTPPMVLCVHCRLPKSAHRELNPDTLIDIAADGRGKPHAFEPINPLDDDGFDVDPDPEPRIAEQSDVGQRVIDELMARSAQNAAPLVLALQTLDPAWRGLVQVLQSVAMAKATGLELGAAVRRFDAMLGVCLALGDGLQRQMTKAQLAHAARSLRSSEVPTPKAPL